MSLSSYGKLATEVYDIDKPIGHSFGDVEFYLQRLNSCTSRILEPAVGTGRVMIRLLEAGLEVQGVDNSPEMLAICRARCAEKGLEPVLHEGDMRSLSLPERYEAIIVPAGSFHLIERREESLGTLKRFREHLVPGGRLILDLGLETDLRVGTISTGTVETPQGETITMEAKVVEVNFLEQYSVSYLRYEKWRDGNSYAQKCSVLRGGGTGSRSSSWSSRAWGLRMWWYLPTTSTASDHRVRSRRSHSKRAGRSPIFSLIKYNSPAAGARARTGENGQGIAQSLLSSLRLSCK